MKCVFIFIAQIIFKFKFYKNINIKHETGSFGMFDFPFESQTLNLNTIHKNIINSVLKLLNLNHSQDLRLTQNNFWVKFDNEALKNLGKYNDNEQRMHMDYPNHTLTHPSQWDTPESVALIVYLGIHTYTLTHTYTPVSLFCFANVRNIKKNDCFLHKTQTMKQKQVEVQPWFLKQNKINGRINTHILKCQVFCLFCFVFACLLCVFCICGAFFFVQTQKMHSRKKKFKTKKKRNIIR